jgi:hypothetical protein
MVWGFSHAQSGTPLAQEGFATYYAALAEREIWRWLFYSKLYETAQQIKYASRTDTIPVLNEKASSKFYQKGLGLCLLYVRR